MTESKTSMPNPKVATKEAVDRAEAELKERGPKTAEEIAEMVQEMKAKQERAKEKSK